MSTDIRSISVRTSALVLASAIQLYVKAATDVPYGDPVYPITSAAADGDLSEWRGRPFRLLNAGEASEEVAAVRAYYGYSDKGLSFAISARTSPGIIATVGPVELFIDVRPRESRMDAYEHGVLHVRIENKGGVSSVVTIDPDGASAPLAKAECAAAYRKLPDGLDEELFVSWSALECQRPSPGDPIGLSVRVWCADPLAHAGVWIGDETTDPSNPLDRSPIAFTVARLVCDPPGDARLQYSAQETVISGQPWLDVRVAVPSEMKDVDLGDLSVGVDGAPARSVSFIRSLVGSRVARLRYRLPEELPTSDVARVEIQTTRGDWHASVMVPIRVTKQYKRIDDAIPESALRALREPGQSLARLFKDFARESAGLLATAPRRFEAPQRVARPLYHPDIYDDKINFFVSWANRLLQGKDIGSPPSIVAWQSRIDGAWLPIKISYPWGFDPAKTYPAQIQLHGLDRNRTPARFVERELRSIDDGQYVPYVGNCIAITPYGRGNSHDTFGREELDYILNELIPKLPIDRRRVSIYGGSRGGPVAFRIAIERPDDFAWIYTRSANLTPFYTDPYKRFRNINNMRAFLVAGGQDIVPTNTARELEREMGNVGISSEVRVLAETGHLFTPPDPPLTIEQSIRPDSPSHVTLVTGDLNAARSYWLTIVGLEPHSDVGTVDATVIPGGLVIKSNGVAHLRVQVSKVKTLVPPISANINGQSLTVNAQSDIDFSNDHGIWRIGPIESPHASKRPGLCGPAREIAQNPFIVVYGTKDAVLRPFLENRAFQVATELVGADVGQIGGGRVTIKADHDISAAEAERDNLWLIGGPELNQLTEKFLPAPILQLSKQPPNLGFGRAHLLLSFIYPRVAEQRYLYLETGSDGLSYSAGVLARPEDDYCIQVVSPIRVDVQTSGRFDNEWRPQ